MRDPWIALHQCQELLFGNHHDGSWCAGDDGGRAFLSSKQRHGTKDLIFLHVTDLNTLHKGLSLPFGDDENMVRFIALANQFCARSKVLKAGYRSDFRLLAVGQGVRHECGLTKDILSELLLALAVAMNMFEQRFAVIGD